MRSVRTRHENEGARTEYGERYPGCGFVHGVALSSGPGFQRILVLQTRHSWSNCRGGQWDENLVLEYGAEGRIKSHHDHGVPGSIQATAVNFACTCTNQTCYPAWTIPMTSLAHLHPLALLFNITWRVCYYSCKELRLT